MNKVFSFLCTSNLSIDLSRYLKSKYNPANKFNPSFKNNVCSCMFVYMKSKYNPAKNKSNLSYARVCLSFLAKCLFFYLECVFVCVQFLLFVSNLSIC